MIVDFIAVIKIKIKNFFNNIIIYLKYLNLLFLYFTLSTLSQICKLLINYWFMRSIAIFAIFWNFLIILSMYFFTCFCLLSSPPNDLQI